MSKPIRVILDDRIEWRLNGELHRDDGPAVEWTKGVQDGDRSWYINGKLHREAGPAIEWFADITNDFDNQEWWLDGVKYPDVVTHMMAKFKRAS